MSRQKPKPDHWSMFQGVECAKWKDRVGRFIAIVNLSAVLRYSRNVCSSCFDLSLCLLSRWTLVFLCFLHIRRSNTLPSEFWVASQTVAAFASYLKFICFAAWTSTSEDFLHCVREHFIINVHVISNVVPVLMIITLFDSYTKPNSHICCHTIKTIVIVKGDDIHTVIDVTKKSVFITSCSWFYFSFMLASIS